MVGLVCGRVLWPSTVQHSTFGISRGGGWLTVGVIWRLIRSSEQFSARVGGSNIAGCGCGEWIQASRLEKQSFSGRGSGFQPQDQAAYIYMDHPITPHPLCSCRCILFFDATSHRGGVQPVCRSYCERSFDTKKQHDFRRMMCSV